MKTISAFAVCLLLCGAAGAADKKPPEPVQVKCRVTGLFAPFRVDDFRKITADMPNVKLLDLNYDTTEAVVLFDMAKAVPGSKPGQEIERLDSIVRNASRHTFGIRAPSAVPADKLTKVEIPVLVLDCKACCLAAYEVVAKIDGVDRATAGTNEIVAWIDASKTNQAALEEALKKRQVRLKSEKK